MTIKKSKEPIMGDNQTKKIKHLYNTYGLTMIDYWALMLIHGNKCAICQEDRPLNVDHRHIKGYKKMKPEDKVKEVRGLLCFQCNKFAVGGIERRNNARFLLENMVKYFNQYKIKGDI